MTSVAIEVDQVRAVTQAYAEHLIEILYADIGRGSSAVIADARTCAPGH
jgi:hypothetical protein